MTGPPQTREVWDEALGQRRCVATAKSTSTRCKRRPIAGGRVCKMHGAGAPQVKRSARLRLAELVDPAIVVLARTLVEPNVATSDKLRAVDAVLDRAGYPRRTQVDVGDARERLTERIAQLRQEGHQ